MLCNLPMSLGTTLPSRAPIGVCISMATGMFSGAELVEFGEDPGAQKTNDWRPKINDWSRHLHDNEGFVHDRAPKIRNKIFTNKKSPGRCRGRNATSLRWRF